MFSRPSFKTFIFYSRSIYGCFAKLLRITFICIDALLSVWLKVPLQVLGDNFPAWIFYRPYRETYIKFLIGLFIEILFSSRAFNIVPPYHYEGPVLIETWSFFSNSLIFFSFRVFWFDSWVLLCLHWHDSCNNLTVLFKILLKPFTCSINWL